MSGEVVGRHVRPIKFDFSLFLFFFSFFLLYIGTLQ